jgi:peptidoglycan/LPS O-acetylase OafA/YrhL
LTYQPSLDGIRALAVLSVMAYHGGLSWAHAGFLGVDMFLVLSGFLITYLLILEIRQRGTVDRRAFWLRRARRLLPALFAVLIAIGIYAVLFSTATQRTQIRGDAFASLLYVQNWRLILQGQSYFAQFGAPSPLRPMWSLAIEEQWYLIWPMVFLALFRVTRGGLVKLAAITGALAATSACLMLALYRPGHDPSRIYYGTDTRAQALLIGAVLALVFARFPSVSTAPARFVVQIFGAGGAAYLVYVVCTANDQSTSLYRGGFTVVALAVAAMIAAAMTPGPVRDLLGIRPLAAVGLISYGLYLWHWPLFLLLSPQRTGLTGTPLALVRFVATFAVATTSYFLLERPIRRGEWAWVRRPARWIPAGAIVVAVCLIITTSTWFPTTAPVDTTANALQGLAAGTTNVSQTSRTPRRHAWPASTRILLAGDSVAFTLGWYGVPKNLERQATLHGAAIIGCGIEAGDSVSNGVRIPLPPECTSWEQTYLGAVNNAQPDVSVLLIGAWELYDRVVDGRTIAFASEEARHDLLQQLDRARLALTSSGAPLVLLTAPCFSPQQQDLGVWGEHERTEPWRVDWLNRVLRQYASAHPTDVTIGDLHKVLCPGGTFAADIAGVHVRNDGVHFTQEGSAFTLEWLIPFARRAARDHPVR